MKPLLVLMRITFIGCLWSIIFIEGVRVIMLENWRFDIFWPPHWMHAWNLWLHGWVIDTAKEWAFVLILLAFIPLWLTGWIALSMLPWEVWAYRVVAFPFYLLKLMFNPITKINVKTPVVVKKKSYKEIRPTGPRKPIYDYNDNSFDAQPKPAMRSAPSSEPIRSTPPANNALKKRAQDSRETFNHALFDFDDNNGDDFELDFGNSDKQDIFSIDSEKANSGSSLLYGNDSEDDIDIQDVDDQDTFVYNPVQQQESQSVDRRKKTENPRGGRKTTAGDFISDSGRNRQDNQRDNRRDNTKQKRNASSENAQRPASPVADVLTQKGYDVISGVSIHNIVVDFIGVAENEMCVCLIDKESGDWLADEERFNNEEPLWFSETSHRVSPVYKTNVACKYLENSLKESGYDIDVVAYVVIQSGNIINAEDMFDTWRDVGVDVTRINRGSPKEIKLFSKTVADADGRMEKGSFNALKKLLKSLS